MLFHHLTAASSNARTRALRDDENRPPMRIRTVFGQMILSGVLFLIVIPAAAFISLFGTYDPNRGTFYNFHARDSRGGGRTLGGRVLRLSCWLALGALMFGFLYLRD